MPKNKYGVPVLVYGRRHVSVNECAFPNFSVHWRKKPHEWDLGYKLRIYLCLCNALRFEARWI